MKRELMSVLFLGWVVAITTLVLVLQYRISQIQTYNLGPIPAIHELPESVRL